MRKGISPLCSVVHKRMGYSVRNNDGGIFIGSNRKLMKLLHIEDGGLVICVKCLEADHFKVPSENENSANPVTFPLICTSSPPTVFMAM